MLKSKSLQGYTFAFTGELTQFKRSEAEAIVEANGGTILSSVTSKLNYLVVGADAGGKLDKAKSVGTITILTEKEFLKMLPKGKGLKEPVQKGRQAQKAAPKKTATHKGSVKNEADPYAQILADLDKYLSERPISGLASKGAPHAGAKQQSSMWKIKKLNGPFGFRREGDGIVVYLFQSAIDRQAVREITNRVYTVEIENEDGELVTDFAEYDPSMLDTDMAGEIEDEITLTELAQRISGKGDTIGRLLHFVEKELFNRDIPLIYVDASTMVISQVTEVSKLHKVLKKHDVDWILYVREYDHAYDY